MPSISQADPIILWFRQDLRISDHAALNAASQSGAPVIPLFIYGEQTPGDWKQVVQAVGGSKAAWLNWIMLFKPAEPVDSAPGTSARRACQPG